MSKLLEISGLRISFESGFGKVDAVRGVNLTMDMGDAVAVVGASGSGKTVLGRSLLGLVDAPGVVRGASSSAERKSSANLRRSCATSGASESAWSFRTHWMA
uniref:ATP-binding cassette domain-containing protein n=1 Tax=Neorhizobium sp. EC2-8 TaxID=3129230 RepID=UPI00310128CD